MSGNGTIFMNFLDLILFQLLHTLTLPHPGALRSPWRVKSSGVRQSKTTKWPLLAALGGKVLRKRDGQIVYEFENTGGKRIFQRFGTSLEI